MTGNNSVTVNATQRRYSYCLVWLIWLRCMLILFQSV